MPHCVVDKVLRLPAIDKEHRAVRETIVAQDEARDVGKYFFGDG